MRKNIIGGLLIIGVLLVLCCISSDSYGQPQQFPSLSSNNVFTGTNTIPVCSYPVALLPTNLTPRTLCVAIDANPNCQSGGGTATALCRWDGVAWDTLAGSSSTTGTVGPGTSGQFCQYSSSGTTCGGHTLGSVDIPDNAANTTGNAATATTATTAGTAGGLTGNPAISVSGVVNSGNESVAGTVSVTTANVLNLTGGGGSTAYTTNCWGDSTTKSPNGVISWCYQLQALLGTGTIDSGQYGDTSTQILARWNATPTAGAIPVSIFFLGINDVAQGVTNATIEANVASLVAGVKSGQYLVLSTLNTTGWPSGSAGYTQIMALNSYFSSTYGGNYLNVRSLLVNGYNPNYPADVTTHTNDVPAASLSADGTHPNTAGNIIIANAVAAKLLALYPSVYPNGPTPIVPSSLTTQNQGIPITNGVMMVGTPLSDLAPLGTELTSSGCWTSTGWTGSYSTGFTNTTSNTTPLSCAASIVAGNLYRVSFSITSGTTGSVSATLGGTPIVNPDGSTAFSMNTEYYVASGPNALNSTGLIITPTSSFNGTISSPSVKQITQAVPNVTWADSTRSDAFDFRSGLGTSASIYFGYESGFYAQAEAQQNMVAGYWAGRNITTGNANSAWGALALYNCTTCIANDVSGDAAGWGLTTGSSNTLHGFNAGENYTTGSGNVAEGNWASRANQTGTGNVVTGNAADSICTNCSDNAVFGANAAQSNLYSGISAFGYEAMQTNTTGSGEAFGSQALQFSGTGIGNDAFGTYALRNTGTGSSNSCFGSQCMSTNTSGNQNSAFGFAALATSSTTSYNSAFGSYSLYLDTAGSNSAFGQYSLEANTTGTGNTAMGLAAGYTSTPANANVSGSQNTWIGANSGPGSTSQLSNTTCVGYGCLNTASSQVVLGGPGVTDVWAGPVASPVAFHLAIEIGALTAGIATGGNLGSGSTATCYTTGSGQCTASSGSITVTTSTTASSAGQAVILNWTATPKGANCTVSGGNAAGASLLPYIQNRSTAGVQIYTVNAPAVSTTYQFTYVCGN